MKLFCKHEYAYYNTRRENSIFGSDYLYQPAIYYFVCKKCGKKKHVYQSTVEYDIEKERDRYKKLCTMNKEYEFSQSSELTIKPYIGISRLYQGNYVSKILSDYKELFNLDLRQLPDNNT